MKPLCILIVLFVFVTTNILAQSDYRDVLTAAKKNYDIGAFHAVVDSISKYLPQLNSSESKIEAHKLLAYTFIATDDTLQSENEITTILSVDLDYEPDLDAPPFFVTKVEQIKRELSSQISYSFSKKPEKTELAPATIEVITEKEILERGYQNLEQLFHDISGFDISSPKGEQYSLLYQRGYRSDLGSRTMVLINGVEDNNLFTNEAEISRQYPISNVKRVEVIYGPASTMYGANAFQGVINIITKDAVDYVKQQKGLAATIHTGYGSWNTKMIDATIAGKTKKMGFTVTARIFQSDEMNLSKYKDHDYSWNPDEFSSAAYRDIMTSDSLNEYNKTVCRNNDPTHLYFNETGGLIIPTDFAIAKARAFDSLAYTNPYYLKYNPDGPLDTIRMKLKYHNPTNDWFVSASLNFEKLKYGFQIWQRKEGQGGLVTDNFFSDESNGTRWEVRQFAFYVKYDNRISDKMFISNFSTYRISFLYPDPRQTILNGYLNGRLILADLALHLTDSTYQDASSWKSYHYYLNSNQIENEFKVVYTPHPRFDIVSGIDFRLGSIPQNQLVLDVRNNTTPAYAYGTIGSDPYGGNIIYSNTFGIYSQASFKIKQLTVSFGGRVDYNIAKDTLGYGVVFNPRVALVYKRNRFIWKGIYASAFVNPSNYEKFGSDFNSNRISNPNLVPERVNNLEFSGRYNYRDKDDKDFKAYSEIIVYDAFYNHAIQTGFSVNSADTTKKIQQFQNTGNLNITGLQFNNKYSFKNFAVMGNYTFTIPLSLDDITGDSASRSARIGDIAAHHVNLGIDAYLLKKCLTVDLRLNYVGSRETGKNTTVHNNPLDEIPAYTILNGAVTFDADKFSNKKALSGITFQIAVSNIMNTEYFDPGARIADGLIYASEIPQEARHYFIKVIYRL